MDDALIAARLEEINEGLCGQTGGLTEIHFRKSKRLGAAVRVANLIKGQDVIDNYEFLLAAAGELRIPADTLEKALGELEEIGYVSLHKSGGEIKKVEERVPLLSKQYPAIGEKWREAKPSSIEKSALKVLDDLMMAPQRERDLIRKLGSDEKSFRILADVGKTGAFYSTYTSPVDNSTISFSPLYNDENPEKIIALFDRFPEEDVSKKIRTIRNYQGLPLGRLNDPVLVEAVKMGCIPTPSVNSTAGEKYFAFTPLQGVGKLEKAILEKARAIVACVRYGQHYAGVTRIKEPLDILDALKRRKRIGAHSEILRQYALLHKLGVGRIRLDSQYPGRYHFHVIDTEDNMRALELAIQYLTVKEVIKADPAVPRAKELLLPGITGTYGSTSATRMAAQSVKPTIMSRSSIDELNHLIIGGSSGIR
jgi:hypothetical protein